MSILLLLFLSVLGLIIIVRKWYKNKLNYWSKKGIASSKDLTFFGNYKDFITVKRTECEATDKEYWKHENVPYCGIYFFWKPQVLIRDIEMAKRIMIKNFDYFMDHPQISSTFKGYDATSHHLFFMKGFQWKNRRSVFTSMFTPSKLKNVVVPINQICSEQLENINMEENYTNIEDLASRITTEITMAVIFGLKVSKEETDQFLIAAKEFSHPQIKVVLKTILATLNQDIHKALNLNTMSKKLYDFFSSFADQNMKNRTNFDGNDLFSYISKVNNGDIKGIEEISNDEIIGQSFLFFIAAQGTTSSTVALTLYELARNSELQSKIRKELEDVLNKSMQFNYEAVKNMKSLENAINETLRMYPPLGLFKRVCTKEYQLDEKLTIPEGMEVIIPVRAFHYDPTIFKDPYLYNPDRFLEDAPWSFMPFGKGPRICLGMRLAEIQTRVILASILLKFEVVPSPTMIDSLSWDPQTLIVTNRPVGGVSLKLVKRK